MRRRRIIGPSFPYVVRPSVAGWAGVTSGLTHHWPMDAANTSGTTTNDIVGSLNGTLTSSSAITLATGPSGAANTALQFDGTNNFITLAGNPYVDAVNTDATLCIWVYVADTTLTNSSGDNAPMFFNFGDGTETYGISYNVGTSPVVPLGATGLGSGNAWNNTFNSGLGAAIASGSWVHLAYTKPGSGDFTTAKEYWNGTDVSQNGSADSSSAATAPKIGARGSNSRLLTAGSRIGRLVIYNRVLSAAEILQNFNAK